MPIDMAMFPTLPELVGPSVIIETVKWHFEDFIGLSQTIPGSVIPFVHLYCMSAKEEKNNVVRKQFRSEKDRVGQKTKYLFFFFNSHQMHANAILCSMSDTYKPG